jgi:hypothetical protein
VKENLLNELPKELLNWIIGIIHSKVGVKGIAEESKQEKKLLVEVEYANP